MSKSDRVSEFIRIKSRTNKELDLFTNVYYKISVKSIPNGVVTYESSPRDEGHLVQLSFNDLDLDLDGEEPFQSSLSQLWHICPATGGQDTDYQIRGTYPEGALTYTHGSSWGGRYMELDLTHPENYTVGATMHSSAMWFFEPSEIPMYFIIGNSDARRNPNFVTFSNEPSQDGQLMQIATKELEQYAPKATFRQDALWSFKPCNYRLVGLVCNFQFDLPSPETISEEAYPLCVMDEVIITSDNPSISHKEEIPETFALCFLQSFKALGSLVIKGAELSAKLPFLSNKTRDLSEFEKRSNTQWACLIGTEFNLDTQGLTLPPGVDQLKVKGFCSVLKQLEIPFTAEVHITANAILPTNCNPDAKNLIQPILDPEVIKHFLKIERFSGKIIQEPKTKKQTPASVTEASDAVVRCSVAGLLKSTCGLDTFIHVQ